MISMTGYTYRERNDNNISISMEIKGCNSRFLEINVNTIPKLSSLDLKIKEHISSFCGRGKIDVFIRIREKDAPVNLSVNTSIAKAYLDAITALAKQLDYSDKPQLETLLKLEGVLEIEKNHDDERYWKIIEPALKEAVEAFNFERAREGKHTEEDILKSIEIIEASLKTVSSFVPALEESINLNLRTRFAECLGNQIDENRILAETAVLLVKYTISEELSRLSSHLSEFRSETGKNARPGKKLDFLCQEMNREINTIGSKSAIFEVSVEVVKMKEALENIREQLRNVE